MVCRYEDLVKYPGVILSEIGNLVAYDFTAVANTIVHEKPLRIGHTVAGNPMRLAGQVRLKPDTEWRENMPTTDKRIFTVLGSWFMPLYGYKK